MTFGAVRVTPERPLVLVGRCSADGGEFVEKPVGTNSRYG